MLLSILAIFTGYAHALLFAVLWLLAKATTFHITMFRELADHVGLKPGAIFSFTRNCPTDGYLKYFFHPHNNGYHLTHHVGQTIPFYNLPKAHKLLLHSPTYRQGYHCESYFTGRRAVVKGWAGDYFVDANVPIETPSLHRSQA